MMNVAVNKVTRMVLLAGCVACIGVMAACKGKTPAEASKVAPAVATEKALATKVPVAQARKGPDLPAVAAEAPADPSEFRPSQGLVGDPQCRETCASVGRCAYRNGKCRIGGPEDCRQSNFCRISGWCSMKETQENDGTARNCTAATDEDCESCSSCKEMGLCKAQNGDCKAATDEDCQESSGCKKNGICKALDGACTKATVADPGCENDCKTIGFCVRKDGRCVVGGAEHCRQADICRSSGGCSTKATHEDDGTTFVTCTAMTDEDCKGSETCKTKGNCKALDGFCTNTADPETQKLRVDRVLNVRDLAFKITKECEVTKAKTLRLFKQDGLPNPAASWAEMDGLSRELVSVVIDFRRGMLANYDVIFSLLDSDKDLLGAGCYDALKAGTTKGKDGCIFDGKKQDVTWLKTIGGSECLPAAPPAPDPAPPAPAAPAK